MWPPLPGYLYAYKSYKKGKLLIYLIKHYMKVSGAHAPLGTTRPHCRHATGYIQHGTYITMHNIQILIKPKTGHQHTKQWKHLTETNKYNKHPANTKTKRSCQWAKQTLYKHTLQKLAYTIQEINTCCHQWAVKTLNINNQYCAPIWELTRLKCCCKLCS